MLTKAQRDAHRMLGEAMDACEGHLPNWAVTCLADRLSGPVLEQIGQEVANKGHMKSRQENGAAPMPEWGSREIAEHTRTRIAADTLLRTIGEL